MFTLFHLFSQLAIQPVSFSEQAVRRLALPDRSSVALELAESRRKRHVGYLGCSQRLKRRLTPALSILSLFALAACSPAAPAPPLTPTRPVQAVASPTGPTRPVKTIASVAQRGGAGLAAENTLAAFRIAANYHPDFVEMDVHLTKDGVPIVMHDPTIDRTTEGRGRIADMTLAELGRFSTHAATQSYREPIPPLAEVVDLAKNRRVQVEVNIRLDADGRRYPGIEQKVLDELIARDMLDRARILSFDFDTLQQVRTIRPDARTVALLSADRFARGGNRTDAALIEDASSFADGIGVDKAFLSADLIEAAHRLGMFVGVWTVDTEAEMEQFARMGVDSISTNRPDVFNTVFQR